MKILHTAFMDGKFWVWGEQTLDSASKHAGSKTKKTDRTGLPFAIAGKDLTEIMAAVTLFKPAGKKARKSIRIWLPTVTDRPLPSHPLIAESLALGEIEKNEKISLQAWKVPALELELQDAVGLFDICTGREKIDREVWLGNDLRFWTQIYRFAETLGIRERFLPAVRESEKKFFAWWTPVFEGEDAEILNSLAEKMPDVGRAATDPSDNNPPLTSKRGTVQKVTGEILNFLVRSKISAPSKKKKFDSLHQQWIHRLQSSDNLLSGKAANLREFADQLKEWHKPLTVMAETPFRLSFRLEEPSNEAGEKNLFIAEQSPKDIWKLNYFLQSVSDQSLLIPLEKVRKKSGKYAQILKKNNFRPQEYLLTAFGQAAKVSPVVEQSLKTEIPGGARLSTAEAFAFLEEHAWLLEQTGFGVLLPAWWGGRTSKLKLNADSKKSGSALSGGSGLTLEEIIKFDWEVALGDEKLTLAELETLAGLKVPLVRVRGQWVQLSADEIAAAAEFWRKNKTGKSSVRELIKMALGAAQNETGLEFGRVKADGKLADLLNRLEGKKNFSRRKTPKQFRGKLRPYQIRGFSWLQFLTDLGFGACLADDMGLGKTPQTLAFIQERWEENGESARKPTLLACPMSVVGNWEKEAEKFTPDLPVMVHHGATRAKEKREFSGQVKDQALVIVTYSLLHRDFELLSETDWAGIVLDEAQNIKNANTKQAKAARRLSSDWRIALTGTPVENNVGDLWSLMEFLNAGWLGNQKQFKENFFTPIQMHGDKVSAARLQKITAPFVLRRLKTDKKIIKDLPDKLEMKVFCSLTKEQASLYEAVVSEANEGLEESEGIGRKGMILATLSKLKQVCNHPAHFLKDNSSLEDRSGKLARLSEMIEEVLAIGEKALVFTQFTEMGELLKKHLQNNFGEEVLFLQGKTAKKQRDKMIERFQSSDKNSPSLFLLSLKAGGTGLNLTAANHVFHFDRWWNPAVENQATDRAFRIGQKRNVQVHKFLCAGTLEEKIDEMIERKTKVADSVVGSGETWLTKLSTEELQNLWKLDRNAVTE